MEASQEISGLQKSVSQDISLRQCASFLSQKEVGTLCLRNTEGRAVGIFARQDLAKAVAAGSALQARAIDWAQPAREEVGERSVKTPGYAPGVNLSDLPLGRQLYDILDSIYNPVLAVDAEGMTVFCNPAMAAVANSTVKDLVGQRAEDFVANTRLPRIIITGQTESVRKITIGRHTYISNRTPIKDGKNVVGALAVLQDISELASIADELERTKELTNELNAIFESSFDGIYVTDGQGRTIRVNKAYERITGLRREELLNRNMQALVEEGFYNQSVTMRVLETQRAESLMQTIRTGKTVMVTGTPIFDRAGEVFLVVTSVRDVTELYNLQSKLEREESCAPNTRASWNACAARPRMKKTW